MVRARHVRERNGEIHAGGERSVTTAPVSARANACAFGRDWTAATEGVRIVMELHKRMTELDKAGDSYVIEDFLPVTGLGFKGPLDVLKHSPTELVLRREPT